MVRAGAARREIRQAKRAIARAESGKKKGKRIAKADVPRRTAKRGATGLRAPPLPEKQAAAKKRPEAVPEPVDEMEPRFTDAEKKLRALEKKLRAVKAIRALVARGVETDAQQQSKLRSEKALLAQLESIRAEVQAEEEADGGGGGGGGDDDDEMVVMTAALASTLNQQGAPSGKGPSGGAAAARGAATAAAAEEEEPPDAPGATADDEDMSGLSKLEQRRRLKKRKHLDKVRARQESLLQREARDSEARAARIALAAAPAAKRVRS